MSKRSIIQKIIKEEFADVLHSYSTLVEQGGAADPALGKMASDASNIMKQFPLKKGSKGELVKKLQKAIGTKADGDFGGNTEGALKKKIQKTEVSIDDYKKLVPGDKSVKGGKGAAPSYTEDQLADAKDIRDLLLKAERTLDTEVKRALGASEKEPGSEGTTDDRATLRKSTTLTREGRDRARKNKSILWEGLEPHRIARDISRNDSRRLFGTRASQVNEIISEGGISDWLSGKLGGDTWSKASEAAAQKVEPIISQIGGLARRYGRSPEASRAFAGAFYKVAKEAGSKNTGKSLAAVLMSCATMGTAIGLSKVTAPLRQLADSVIANGTQEEKAFQQKHVAKRVEKSKSLIKLWTKEGVVKRKEKSSEKALAKKWDRLDDAAESAAKKLAKAIQTFGSSGGSTSKSKKSLVDRGMDMAKSMMPSFEEGDVVLEDDPELMGEVDVANFDEDKIESAIETYVKKVERLGLRGEKADTNVTGWKKTYTADSLLDYWIKKSVDGFDSWREIYRDDKADLKSANKLMRTID